MKVTKEICSFDELYQQSWSGAKDTLKTIMNNGLEEELMSYLDEIFYDDTDETTLNDFLWFDSEVIFKDLGIEKK